MNSTQQALNNPQQTLNKLSTNSQQINSTNSQQTLSKLSTNLSAQVRYHMVFNFMLCTLIRCTPPLGIIRNKLSTNSQQSHNPTYISHILLHSYMLTPLHSYPLTL